MLMPVLRDKPMRGYAQVIVQEVEQMIAGWAMPAKLICLSLWKNSLFIPPVIAPWRWISLWIERGICENLSWLEKAWIPWLLFSPICLTSIRRRDKARARLQELVTGIIAKRAQKSEKVKMRFNYWLKQIWRWQSLIGARNNCMLIGTIFAGHHTTAGTAAWTLLELHADQTVAVVLNELDELFGAMRVTFSPLREFRYWKMSLKKFCACIHHDIFNS